MAVYACSDLHGNYHLWEKIKNILTENDTLYFLGDSIDRGPDGWSIFKEMMDDKRVIYICGNHEDMFYNSYLSGFAGRHMEVWSYNGNEPTYEAMMHDPDAFDYIERIAELPIQALYKAPNGNIIYMTHSGCTELEFYNRYNFDRDDAIWDRSHYFATKWHGDNNEYIVHGHTPIPHLIENAKIKTMTDEIPMEPFFYCEGHKIDIDLLTIVTHETVLLNLDDFSFIEITEEED